MRTLLAHQLAADLRVFWRDPAAVGFTVALPLIFLVLFVSIFGNTETVVDGRTVEGATYYVPGILSLSIASAAFVNLAISVTIARERGILKRARATPIPPWAFMAGRVGAAVSVSIGLTVVVALFGAVLYGVELPGSTLIGAIVAVLLGSATFAALGLAVTAVLPSENSAAPVTNVIVLPLYFISGIFVPAEQLPEIMRTIADLFPVKPLFDALLEAFTPTTTGLGLAWADLAVLAAWGSAGAGIAAQFFRWSPRG
ncbi:MAG TPA: ABC transporter permease [Solirubrobacteraceae bacterium]|nr:ABC transporter permease [Solirubrobacteraceae bacterium]